MHLQGLLDQALQVDKCGEEHHLTPNKPLVSKAIFAHVRMATPGGVISDANAHPFIFSNLLFMHNGALAHFEDYRATLLKRLRPAVSP